MALTDQNSIWGAGDDNNTHSKYFSTKTSRVSDAQCSHLDQVLTLILTRENCILSTNVQDQQNPHNL